jgi:hypothetical protein
MLPTTLKRRIVKESWRVTERADAALPQTAEAALFTITGGRIVVRGIIGLVGTVVQTQANNTKLVEDPTTGANTDMCAVLDLTAAASGAVYSIDGLPTVALTLGGFLCATPTVCRVGAIDLNCAASNTGTMAWTLIWSQLDWGASVVAA